MITEENRKKKMEILVRTCLIVMVLSLLQVQGKQVANVASRTGQMSQLASKAIQKIQRMDPTLLQNNLENSRLTFEKLKSSYRWFQRLREVIQKRKDENLESEDPQTSDLENLSKMVQVCRPDTKNLQDSCYSPCVKKKTDYRWCFTSSELRGTVWSPCTCKIKPAVLQFLDISRQNMLSTPSNPWTNLEISLIVVASCLGALITVSVSVAAVAYLRRQEDLAMHQGVVFPNPIFVPEDGQ